MPPLLQMWGSNRNVLSISPGVIGIFLSTWSNGSSKTTSSWCLDKKSVMTSSFYNLENEHVLYTNKIKINKNQIRCQIKIK